MNFEAWPLVQVTCPPRVSDEELRRHFEAFEAEAHRRGGQALLVLDLRVCERISVAQRRMMTERLEANDKSGLIRGCAMVFESRVLRGVLTAMFWVYRPRYPTRIFVNHRDALEWAESMIERGGAAGEPRFSSRPPASRPPASAVPDSQAFERQPKPGSWIVHVDASRNRNVAAEMVDALRATDQDAYLCEKKLNSDLSLWMGWLGPFSQRDEAFEARDDLARRGVLLTVSQWVANTG